MKEIFKTPIKASILTFEICFGVALLINAHKRIKNIVNS